jgi:hypothetical protein
MKCPGDSRQEHAPPDDVSQFVPARRSRFADKNMRGYAVESVALQRNGTCSKRSRLLDRDNPLARRAVDRPAKRAEPARLILMSRPIDSQVQGVTKRQQSEYILSLVVKKSLYYYRWHAGDGRRLDAAGNRNGRQRWDIMRRLLLALIANLASAYPSLIQISPAINYLH